MDYKLLRKIINLVPSVLHLMAVVVGFYPSTPLSSQCLIAYCVLRGKLGKEDCKDTLLLNVSTT